MIKKIKSFLLQFSVPIIITIFVILQLTVIKMNIIDYIICIIMILLVDLFGFVSSMRRLKDANNLHMRTLKDIINLSMKTMEELKERELKLERNIRYYKERSEKFEKDLTIAKNKTKNSK